MRAFVENANIYYYWFIFGWGIGESLARLFLLADWLIDLQIIVPTKPWNRYNRFYEPSEIHEHQ